MNSGNGPLLLWAAAMVTIAAVAVVACVVLVVALLGG
jgi:hypothetical protein